MNDLEDIKNLNQKLFYNDYLFDKTLDLAWPSKNKKYFKKHILDKNSLTQVAEDKGKIIGYAIGSITKAESYRIIKHFAELENMLIIKNYRGKGIGTKLILNFLQWAKNKGIKRTRMIASADNKEAIALYKKIGFKEHNIILEQNT